VTADPDPAPELWLARHGATAWSLAGRHTGRTDLPLTAEGEAAAKALAAPLAAVRFDRVVTSPLQRARRTAELAGFAGARPDDRAMEWDYGDYEGLTRAQIREQVPDWLPWTHPVMPHGESLDQVAARADALLADLTAPPGRVLLFAHAHLLRVLAARWLAQPARFAAALVLDPATLSLLGLDRGDRVIRRWNAPPVASP
jgi:broad specificity phosphatase PhoE